jgi:glycosyltransferase involved in cell wall biosynthesis
MQFTRAASQIPALGAARSSIEGRAARTEVSGLRVALFVNSVEMGGVEEHVRQIAAGLRARGAAVVVICPEINDIDPLALALDQAGVEVRRLTLTWRTGFFGCLNRFSQLVRLFADRRVQVVHIHLTGYQGGRWALLAARLARVPAVVCTIQIAPESAQRWQAQLERRVTSWFVDWFIAVSQVTRGRLVAYLGQSATKTVVIPNAVELERYENVPSDARREVREQFGISADAPVIGVAARLSPQKGLNYLIDALPAILARVANLHVLLVGDGPLQASLQEQVDQLQLTDRVHFAGYRRDVPRYLSALDVFVLPSLFEGLPLSILEAMAAGLPVVATNVDGTPEAVEHDVTGKLVPPADPPALADAVLEILGEPGLAAQMGGAGRERARDFSESVLLDRITGLYEQVLRGRRNA